MPSVGPSAELLAFAATLRGIRRVRDLSQEALAARANLHPNHISDIERANKDPRLSTIVKLAAALEVEVSDLFPSNGPTRSARGWWTAP